MNGYMHFKTLNNLHRYRKFQPKIPNIALPKVITIASSNDIFVES